MRYKISEVGINYSGNSGISKLYIHRHSNFQFMLRVWLSDDDKLSWEFEVRNGVWKFRVWGVMLVLCKTEFTFILLLFISTLTCSLSSQLSLKPNCLRTLSSLSLSRIIVILCWTSLFVFFRDFHNLHFHWVSWGCQRASVELGSVLAIPASYAGFPPSVAWKGQLTLQLLWCY